MFPLISLSDIISINRLTLTVENIDQCDVTVLHFIPKKTNNDKFESIVIHSHQIHSSSYLSPCDDDTNDNVCLDLQNYYYSLKILIVR